jgi:hypothetical protein
LAEKNDQGVIKYGFILICGLRKAITDHMGLGQINPQHGVGGGGWDLPELEMVCIRNKKTIWYQYINIF